MKSREAPILGAVNIEPLFVCSSNLSECCVTEEGGELRDDDAVTDVNSLMTGMSMYTENTHTGQTTAASGSGRGGPASTQGGRHAQQHRGGKGKAKGGKIRQGETHLPPLRVQHVLQWVFDTLSSGGPREEASLVDLLSKLCPSDDVLKEAGQLCEMLVFLGHFGDARTLQRHVAKWSAAHQVRPAVLFPRPAGWADISLWRRKCWKTCPSTHCRTRLRTRLRLTSPKLNKRNPSGNGPP